VSGLELWWLGQSSFRLRDPAGGPLLFLDPFLSPHRGRAWEAPISPEELGRRADVILCTHEHVDHFDRPALRAAAATPGSRFSLVLPLPLVDRAVELGIPRERVVGAQPDEPLVLAGARVHPVPARHGVNVADAYNFGQQLSDGLVRYLGYVVELGDVRAYHAGDTIVYDGQAERLRALRPHLALLPINGRDFFRETEDNTVGNLDPREAARLASDIGARALIPMHWELFPFNRGFPRDLTAYVAEFLPELTLLIMGRGARVTYVPPAEA